jgi:hypothetical protein
MTIYMSDEQMEKEGPEEKGPEQIEKQLPSGITRLREEWVKEGLVSSQPAKKPIGLEPVIFPESVGDYKVSADDARGLLGLSEDAMDRLLESGELDSILVKSETGSKRMISQSALSRFLEDSGMSAELSEKLAFSSEEITSTLEAIRQEINEVRELHSRQLQQFKDILLLELRNLKDQDRDLTSFVYDLTSGLEEVYPKLKKRKRTSPPDDEAE